MRGMLQQIYSHYHFLPNQMFWACRELLQKWPDNDNYSEAIRHGSYRHQLLRQLLQDANTWKFEPFVLLVAAKVIRMFFPDEYEHDSCQIMNEFSYRVVGRVGESYMDLLLEEDALFENFFGNCLKARADVNDESRWSQVLNEFISISKQNNLEFMVYQYDGLQKLEDLFPCGSFVSAFLGLPVAEDLSSSNVEPTGSRQLVQLEGHHFERFTTTFLNSKKPENDESKVADDQRLPSP